MFQFLIGTIKTGLALLLIGAFNLFQFLIGTIKTETLEFSETLEYVSIPHRYD